MFDYLITYMFACLMKSRSFSMWRDHWLHGVQSWWHTTSLTAWRAVLRTSNVIDCMACSPADVQRHWLHGVQSSWRTTSLTAWRAVLLAYNVIDCMACSLADIQRHWLHGVQSCWHTTSLTAWRAVLLTYNVIDCMACSPAHTMFSLVLWCDIIYKELNREWCGVTPCCTPSLSACTVTRLTSILPRTLVNTAHFSTPLPLEGFYSVPLHLTEFASDYPLITLIWRKLYLPTYKTKLHVMYSGQV